MFKMIFELHLTNEVSPPLILESQEGFERKNCGGTFPCLKISSMILAEITAQEDTRFLGSEMFADLVFYLWQLLPHLRSSAALKILQKKIIHSFPTLKKSLYCQWIHVVICSQTSVVFFSSSFFFFFLRFILQACRNYRLTYYTGIML